LTSAAIGEALNYGFDVVNERKRDVSTAMLAPLAQRLIN
jgi:hypothetical protein